MVTKLISIRGIIIVSFIAVATLVFFTLFYTYPSFYRFVLQNTEDEAVRIARHMPSMFLEEELVSGRPLSPEYQRHIEQLRSEFRLHKVKIFSRTGEVVYSTDPEDRKGHTAPESFFHQTVVKGSVFSKVVKKDSKTLEGIVTKRDVAEIYVPLMKNGQFIGAFEIYMDITERLIRLSSLMNRLHAITLGMAIVLFIVIGISSYRALSAVKRREFAEKQLREQASEIEKANFELLVLYEISSAISRTIDPYELFDVILNTVTSLPIFGLERKGGIFLLEGDRLRLVAHLGHSDTFLELHKDIKVGDCLCGLAAKTGEIIISKNSAADSRHTIQYPDITPHGHIVVPLKSPNRRVGVLYLYLPADFKFEDHTLWLFESIGTQLGTAIENARLYEETKTLALRDPLTGLPNRRLMEIVLERLVVSAQRYGSRFSAIMLDIDFFKKYNDAYGHSAGDELLQKIASIISDTLRQSDIAVRYGGEEFLILLPETDIDDAFRTAERLRLSVAQGTPVTVSLGVASYEKDMAIKSVIDRADFALYKAKQAGRNRVERSI